MTVYPSRFPIAQRSDPFLDPGDDEASILPAWLLATVLVAFFALLTLSRMEPFHYDGVGRHLAVAALFVAYMVVWKEIFRRYLE
jgi:hypothetical protein